VTAGSWREARTAARASLHDFEQGLSASIADRGFIAPADLHGWIEAGRAEIAAGGSFIPFAYRRAQEAARRLEQELPFGPRRPQDDRDHPEVAPAAVRPGNRNRGAGR
jgi:hypothetical protein